MNGWSWLQQHGMALSGIANMLFVVIWTAYLQMFYRQYRRQRRPHLVIHHAQSHSPGASCLLVNMSEEPVHVECVMACIKTEQDERVSEITDFRRISLDEGNPEQLLRQGPLKAGDYLLLGQFETMIQLPDLRSDPEAHVEKTVQPLDGAHWVELRAVAIHGPTNHPVGARRRFAVRHADHGIEIWPDQRATHQLRSRRDASLLRQWLDDCFATTARID